MCQFTFRLTVFGKWQLSLLCYGTRAKFQVCCWACPWQAWHSSYCLSSFVSIRCGMILVLFSLAISCLLICYWSYSFPYQTRHVAPHRLPAKVSALVCMAPTELNADYLFNLRAVPGTLSLHLPARWSSALLLLLSLRLCAPCRDSASHAMMWPSG